MSSMGEVREVRVAASWRRRGRLVGEVAGELVLEPQFFFLQTVEKVFVGVRPVLFLIDQRMERGVLGLESLDLCLVHRCHSFPYRSHDPVINHETCNLSCGFSAAGRTGAAPRRGRGGSSWPEVAVNHGPR